MKILCHVGPWCVEQYTYIARGVEPAANLVLMSHFLEIDQTSMAKEYYVNLQSYIDNRVGSDIDSNDFIKRCRVLRSMNKDIALLHLYSMKKAVSNTFDREKPDIVISEVIDQYLIDLIRLESEKRSIPFFGLVVSFVNGYFRITSRGEKGVGRSVSKVEVNNVIKRMENVNYTPKFVSRTDTNIRWYVEIAKRVVSNWARIPYFFFKRVLSKQRYNYHYWASQISAVNNLHICPFFWLGNKKWKDKIRKINKTIIYHPLQMYPEATIEYWCECLDDIEYDKKLIRIVNSMKGDFHFLIKEHPNVIGGRKLGLYRALLALDNITFIPTESNSNDVIEKSDAVLVWTGSVGFEAALRGKPVLTVCEPYYAFGNKFKKINEHTSNSEISVFIRNNSSELSYDDKYALVSNLLSVLRPGHYINDSSWSKLNSEHLQQALDIAEEIKKELSRGT